MAQEFIDWENEAERRSGVMRRVEALFASAGTKPNPAVSAQFLASLIGESGLTYDKISEMLAAVESSEIAALFDPSAPTDEYRQHIAGAYVAGTALKELGFANDFMEAPTNPDIQTMPGPDANGE